MSTTTISWTAFWTCTGAVVTGAGAALLALSGLHTAASVAVLVVVGIVVLAVAPGLIRGGELLGRLAPADEALVLRALAVAIGAHTMLAVAWVAMPQWWLAWSLALIALGGLAYAAARGLHTYVQKRQAVREREAAERLAEQQRREEAAAAEAERARAQVERSGGLPATVEPTDPRWVIKHVLEQGGWRGWTIGDWTPIGGRDGVPPMGIRVELQAQAGTRRETPTLGEADIEPMAVLLQEALGVELQSNWVHIDKLRGAGRYAVSVTLANAFGVIYPYGDPVGPQSIKTPQIVGYDITGRPHREPMGQHWADVGATRSGKTSLIQVKRAYTSLCTDATRWVCGTEKLFDSLAAWIEPYLGTDHRLPFDWIASGPEDTATMLATAMGIARRRQAAPYAVRAQFKTLIVELDEAAFFLVMRHILTRSGDQECTPSMLALDMVRGAGSADVWLHLASQRGTGPNWGEQGTDINANIQAQTVFKTGDAQEIGRLLDSWRVPVPSTKGEFLIRPSLLVDVDVDDAAADIDAGGLLRLKSPYIQENDPSKPRLHDGPTLSDISWSRRHHTDQLGLDDFSAAAARQISRAYARRRTSADDIWAYLTGSAVDLAQHGVDTHTSAATAEPTIVAPAPPSASTGEDTGKGSVYDAVRASLADTIAATLTDADTTPTAEAPAAEPAARTVDDPHGADTADEGDEGDRIVVSIADHRPRHERIVEIVRQADGPIGRAAIIAALAAGGDHAAERSPNAVSNELGRLVDTGVLAKPERDQYIPATTRVDYAS